MVEVDWDIEAAEKSGYETFMLKEIYEQPEAVAETLGDRIRHGELVLESLGLSEVELQNLRRIVIVAAGTSYHAGVVGRYMIEEWARVPVEPDIASEWISWRPTPEYGRAPYTSEASTSPRHSGGTAMSTIAVEALTKRYGTVTAVNDLTFELAPGRITGFLGPNGAGKSTTIRRPARPGPADLRPRHHQRAPLPPNCATRCGTSAR